MAEVTSLKKFACPACGADAEWNPVKKALVCPFCGAVSPMELKPDAAAQVVESDLLEALKAVPPEQRGWAVQKKTVRCQNCGAVSVFDAARVSQRCDFCGSPSLIAEEDVQAPIRPIALLPFHLAEKNVRDEIRKWYGSHWFAPNTLKDKALTDTLKGVYLPYWTFDAQVAAQWRAEVGYTTYVENDKGEREERVRWERASGALNHFFDDMLVPASRGVKPQLLRKIEPFPTTKDLTPYDPGYLSGWVAEQYQVDLPTAAGIGRQQMEAELRNLCAAQTPGDQHRNLEVSSQYSAQTYKHILLPIWLVSYDYGAKSYQVVVNGYTGKIAGQYPLSWIKVSVAIVVGLIAIVIWLVLTQGHHVQHAVHYSH